MDGTNQHWKYNAVTGEMVEDGPRRAMVFCGDRMGTSQHGGPWELQRGGKDKTIGKITPAMSRYFPEKTTGGRGRQAFARHKVGQKARYLPKSLEASNKKRNLEGINQD